MNAFDVNFELLHSGVASLPGMKKNTLTVFLFFLVVVVN